MMFDDCINTNQNLKFNVKLSDYQIAEFFISYTKIQNIF